MQDSDETATTYSVIRNDGMPYMSGIDRDTAMRLVRQLNDKYMGTYGYSAHEDR